MKTVTYGIDGQAAGTPKGAEGTTLEANFEKGAGNDEAEIKSTDQVTLVLADAQKCINHIDLGLNGGVGIFEGLPYNIDVDSTRVFDGIINLADNAKIISCNEIDVSLRKTAGADWLTENADGFSFAFLRSQGFITDSDYEDVAYVLNYRPEAFMVVQLLVTSFVLTKELAEATKAIVDSSADFIESITIGTAIDIGDVIAAGLRLAANIAYAVVVLIALIKTIDELIQQFFPPVRRYRGMKIKRMFEVGMDYLGLTFSSSIFNDPKWDSLVFLPIKSEMGKTGGGSNGLGHPTQSSAVYNFGDFLRTMIQMFNADYKITGSNFVFERRDFWNTIAAYTLPDVFSNQSRRLNEIEYNTNEFVKNLLLSMRTDIQDQNTLENFRGTNYQVIQEPNVVNVQQNVIGKGLAQIQLPFSRGTRKDGLTDAEELIKDLAKLADKVSKSLNGNSNLAAKIQNRVGMMSLSADTTSGDKLLFMDGDNLSTTQIEMSMLWNEFHFIDSFVEVNGKHNQNIYLELQEIPFCPNDWTTLLNNNRLTTSDGRQGEVLNIKWSIYKDTANMRVKISQLYTKNLKLVFNEGQ